VDLVDSAALLLSATRVTMTHLPEDPKRWLFFAGPARGDRQRGWPGKAKVLFVIAANLPLQRTIGGGRTLSFTAIAQRRARSEGRSRLAESIRFESAAGAGKVDGKALKMPDRDLRLGRAPNFPGNTGRPICNRNDPIGTHGI
jgi:hypothetical protein